MSIRGVDANLTVARAAEQSPHASQSARYHEALLDKLAARAHLQEARDAERTAAVNQAENPDMKNLDADGGGLGGGGSGGAQEDRETQTPDSDDGRLSLPADAVPVNRLDITV